MTPDRPAPDRPAQGGARQFVRARLARGGRYGLGLTLAVAATFAALWVFVAMLRAFTDAGGVAEIDRAVQAAVQPLVSDALTPWVVALTDSGSTASLTVLVVLVAGGLLVARRRWEALQLVAASGVGGLVVRGLKEAFERPRPTPQVIDATGFSFPSGHAFAATVFYGTLLTIVWQITDRVVWRTLAAIAFPVLAVSIGLSRVYLNVHYITDVVAGFAAGLVWLTAVYLVIDGVEHRRKRAEQAVQNVAQGTDAGPRRAA